MTRKPILAIANRGEIAIRIARTAEAQGWQPVVLLGEPDLDGLAARTIDYVICVGPGGSELDPQKVVAAAVRAGAIAIHPGYGFLSERADFAQACADAGIAFVGPSPQTLALCGDKIATRTAAVQAGVPVLAASEPLTLADRMRWSNAADVVGYPLIVKVVGGGGGRGLRTVEHAADLPGAIESALREAGASAAGTRVYLERYLVGARHVEVQIAGNGDDAVAIGDRDCSVQRRHQKVIEEAPAFGLSESLRRQLHTYAVTMAREVRIRGLCTVEFLLSSSGELAFIEINPRLQVEHTVTEEVTGLDLVALQLSLLSDPTLPLPAPPHGHAIQARLYAEDPAADFAPSPGTLRVLDWPRVATLRIDAGYAAGDSISGFYDPLIAKIIAWGGSRADAIYRLHSAIVDTRLAGVASNRPWLRLLLEHPQYRTAQHDLSVAEAIHVSKQPPPPGAISGIAQTMLPAADSQSAWESSGPFRLVGHATQVFHGQDNNWQDGVAYSGTPRHWTTLEDAQHDPDDHAVIMPTDDGWEISSVHGRWLVAAGPIPQQHQAAAKADGALRAPMPGTIATINVDEGQRVTEGEVLATMIAMKIEIALAAPFDGIVTRIGCAPGDLVNSRQVIVTVAATQDDVDEAQAR